MLVFTEIEQLGLEVNFKWLSLRQRVFFFPLRLIGFAIFGATFNLAKHVGLP